MHLFLFSTINTGYRVLSDSFIFTYTIREVANKQLLKSLVLLAMLCFWICDIYGTNVPQIFGIGRAPFDAGKK